MEVSYVFGGRDLSQIAYTSGTLSGAKIWIETLVQVERYDEDAGQIFAVVDGQRQYRIERQELR